VPRLTSGEPPDGARPRLSLAFDPAVIADALSPSVERITVLCLGWAGWIVPALLAPDRPVTGVAWIGPRGELSPGDFWDLPAEHCPPLLLVTSTEQSSSSALAADLFARFNETSELRLFSRGEDLCQLTEQRWLRAGVTLWLAGRLGLDPQ